MRKLLLTIIFCFALFAMLGARSVYAAVIEQKIDRELRLRADHVEVTEQLTTTVTDERYFIPAGSDISIRIFNPIIGDEEAQQKINATLPTIKVTDLAGKTLRFKTEISGQDIVVKVSYPQDVRAGFTQRLDISYRSFALSSKTGAVYDVYIPSFSEGVKFDDEKSSLDIHTTVTIPQEFGELNLVNPQKTPTIKNKSWVVEFSKEDLTGVTAWMQVGRKQYFDFEITQKYNASSELGVFSNQYKVILPRDVAVASLEQKVFFSKLDPAPQRVELDGEGNLIAHYSFPANQSGEIVIAGYVVVENSKGVELSGAGTLSDLSQTMRARYTAPAKYWESDNSAIQEQASKLQQGEQDIYKIINATYAYVVDQIDYSEVKRFGLNERQGALRTLQGGAAVCMEYSDLFIALLRAQGVPARAAFGYGYDPRTTNGVDTAHQWAEVYAPNLKTWIMVDTTWGESGDRVIGADLNHFYKYVAAASPLEPAPISVRYFGEIGEISAEDFRITATDRFPNDLETSEAFTSQEELLDKFKPGPEGLSLGSLLTSFIYNASQLNTSVDDVIESNWGVTNPTARQLVRFGVYALPLLTIVALYTFVDMLRRQGKQDKIKNISVTYRGKPQ